uniref:Expansin n=1 Tax=Manihot esculenta TaxID=3983 RepID=A0A199UA76_MANES
MASPLGALSAMLLLLVVALAKNCEATAMHSAIHAVRRHGHKLKPIKQNKSKFKSGPWRKAHATFYGGGTDSFGGACGYKDVVQQGYTLNTAAISDVLFKKGKGCGGCFELKCVNSPKWCKKGSLFVTATNLCPSNPSLPGKEHFDIAQPVFNKIADYIAGIIPIQYRRVPCNKKGGIRFTIMGNPWFNQVIVWNVGGAGDVVSLQVKGNDNVKWTKLERDWGVTWKTSTHLVGESLTFRVTTSDGRELTSWHVAPKNWQFGQTYEGKNFK